MTLRIAVVGHIRHPIARPYKGGMETFTHRLVSLLARDGHDVTLLASGDSEADLPDGAKLIPILPQHYDKTYNWHTYHGSDVLNTVLDASYARACAHLAEAKYDVVHNNCLHRFIPRLAKSERIPMVTSLHIPPFGALRRAIEDSEAPWHLKTVTSNRQLDIWWPEGEPVTADVVYNGVDLRQWRFQPGGTGSALWSGRITPTKGTHLALEAARRAEVPLWICGVIEHQDYFDSKIAPFLGDGVAYLGHLKPDQLRDQMARSSVMLFTPQWEEPFGLAAVEAMATGLPVAALPNGAVREVIGEGGVIATDDTADALVIALRRAFDIDPTAARARVRRLFDQQRMKTRFVGLYGDAMAGARRADDMPVSVSAIERVVDQTRGSQPSPRGILP